MLLSRSFVRFRNKILIDDMNINEKRQKLEEARRILKSEFIGIDYIIDQLIQSVTPWYITPEILDRPLVISLWGITGTGKTSIVKRLFEILSISRVVLFDSGELIDKTMLGEMITEALSLDDSYNTIGCSDTVFVFDEFQHARTIDERGAEITKPSIRQMWNLIDSGTLVTREFNYNAMKLNVFLEDLESLIATYPGIPVEEIEIKDPECVKNVLSTIGLVWYDTRAKAVFSNKIDEHPSYDEDYYDDESDVSGGKKKEKNDDPLRPLSAIPSAILRAYFTVAARADKSKSAKERFDELMSCKTLDEIYDTLGQIRDSLAGQKKFDFSKSIIFLIGNLDEAFYGSDNVDPDLNADMFKKRIDKVTISTIKEALGKRFRAEQIARFGNTILKYPAFTSQNYHELIRFELDKLLKRFHEHTGKTITYTEDVVDLIYSEGVFPAQGCRPVFTTITNMFTPLLSSAIIDFKEEDKVIEASVVDPEAGYRVDSKDIKFTAQDSRQEKIHTLPLVLGASRNPKNNPMCYGFGVHEAGHAVVESFLTGELPLEVVSTSAAGGGHTSYARYSDENRDINRKLLRIDIMGYLGGIRAERMMFNKYIGEDVKEDEEFVLLGSKSDLDRAFSALCSAAYKMGLYKPCSYASENTTERSDGTVAGLDAENNEINLMMNKEMRFCIDETDKILRANKKLVAAVGKMAAERGAIYGKDFYELVERYQDEDKDDPYKLTTERMMIAREEISFDYYKNIVLKETEG